MTVPAVDLGVQRALTTAFINQLPVTVTLVPQVRTKTASGGFKDTSGAPRQPQVVAIVQSPPDPNFPVVGGDGREVRTTYEMVMEWDAEVDVNDTFTIAGQTGTWHVTQLYYENGWERRAAVEKIG